MKKSIYAIFMILVLSSVLLGCAPAPEPEPGPVEEETLEESIEGDIEEIEDLEAEDLDFEELEEFEEELGGLFEE
jgi:hypothetical protein